VGLVLAALTLTRTVGLPLIAVFAVWFLVRGRPRLVAALLIAALVPLGGYAAWFSAVHHRFGLIGSNGVFLYARTMAFADCSVMKPSPDLAVLCDPRPPSRRPPSQEYVWAQDSPLVKVPGITFLASTDRLAAEFAALAIRSQPGDYLSSFLDELGRSFTWGRPVYPDQEVYSYYEFPSRTPPPPGRYPATVGADLAVQYERGAISTSVVEPYAAVMRGYQRVFRPPGAVLLIILLSSPILAGVRRFRTGLAWVLPWATAITLLVVPAATVEFDYRYVLPVVPLACLAAVMAGHKSPEPAARKVSTW
jgi:hypothetical protein